MNADVRPPGQRDWFWSQRSLKGVPRSPRTAPPDWEPARVSPALPARPLQTGSRPAHRMKGTQLELNGDKRDAGFQGDWAQQGPLPVPWGRRAVGRRAVGRATEMSSGDAQSDMWEANDSMSGAQEELLPATSTATAWTSSVKGSRALGLQEHSRTQAALFEFQVFTITLAVLASCILAFTGLYCITVFFQRNRQWKRAHAYESAVSGGAPLDPVAVRAVRRSTSFINSLGLFRRPQAARDRSRIFYIYSNPLPIGLEDEEEQEEREAVVQAEEERGRLRGTPCGLEEPTAPSGSLLIRKYAEDPNSRVTLDPPMFYMQL